MKKAVTALALAIIVLVVVVRIGTDGVDVTEQRAFTRSFEKTRDVPLEIDVVDEGDGPRLSRLALRTPTDPLELPAAAAAATKPEMAHTNESAR